MNPVELATAIGALANTQLHYNPKRGLKKQEVVKEFKHKNDVVNHFIKSEEENLLRYNIEMAKLDDSHRPIEFNQNAIHHIYNWANYNNINENSTQNWARIMKTSGVYLIKDEGSLFKEISLTIDLLKQITEICDEGKELSSDILEQKYYSGLKETAQEAIALLSKEPVV